MGRDVVRALLFHDMCLDMSYYYQYYSYVDDMLSREETQHARMHLRPYLHNSISAIASGNNNRSRKRAVVQYCISSSKYSV